MRVPLLSSKKACRNKGGFCFRGYIHKSNNRKDLPGRVRLSVPGLVFIRFEGGKQQMMI